MKYLTETEKQTLEHTRQFLANFDHFSSRGTWAEATQLHTEISALLNGHSILKDKDGNPIHPGDTVLVPDPDETDIHNHEFTGFVVKVWNSLVIVQDGEGETYSIEPERLKIVNV